MGSAVGMSTKAHLPNYLRRAAQAQGLAIMGSGWGDVPEFAPYWHGILPQVGRCLFHQLNATYSFLLHRHIMCAAHRLVFCLLLCSTPCLFTAPAGGPLLRLPECAGCTGGHNGRAALGGYDQQSRLRGPSLCQEWTGALPQRPLHRAGARVRSAHQVPSDTGGVLWGS